MASLLKFFKKIFSDPDPVQLVQEESGGVGGMEPETSHEAASVPAAVETPDPPPAQRTVIQAPVLTTDSAVSEDSAEILITAQPTAQGDQCLFRVNRTLMDGHSWWFPDFESAAGSPLAEALFSQDDVESALVIENTITVTRKDKGQIDWKPLGKGIGAAIRKLFEDRSLLISEKIIQQMPSEEQIREDIQKVIDTEVNPGVAGHGGNISLLGIKGNTVTIQMGGGCQGCSAADLTLKQGIHTAFRKSVPKVGAILDETDHSAGLNPYFS